MNAQGPLDPLTILAHELKSPLSLIRQLTLSLDENLDPKDLKQISESLVLTSDRALRLVSDLTKVARLEDAMFDLEPINPTHLTDEVLRSLGTTYRLRRENLKITNTAKNKLLVASPALLSSIIYNFCDNALHYGSREIPSEIFIKDSKGKIRIGVRDFGPALPLTIWHKIRTGKLEPAALSSRPASSGLGLFISSRFAIAMHSELQVTRHRDGTSFFLDLPISQQLSLL